MPLENGSVSPLSIQKDLEKLRSGMAVPFSAEPISISTDPNLASEFYERLVEWINDFNKSLGQEHEVGVRLVNFGQTVVFHLQDIGYCDPSLISFMGSTDKGEPLELIQHVSQISILLMKLKRQDPNKPKIGFRMDKGSADGGRDKPEKEE